MKLGFGSMIWLVKVDVIWLIHGGKLKLEELPLLQDLLQEVLKFFLQNQ